MGADQNIDWRCAMISALEWWHDAGVDTLVDDAPRDWLAVPAPLPAPASPAKATGAALPSTLAAFLAWRDSGGAPEAGWSGGAIAASGPADAQIMVLVNCPDAADGDALMTGGKAGRLFGRMLGAIGLSRDAVHIAALCLKRPPAGRVPRGDEARLAEIALHHVALVAPKRLLLMGDAASCAVLGANVATMRGGLRPLNQDGRTTVVATFHPELLLKRPECKAAAWKDLRMLVEGL